MLARILVRHCFKNGPYFKRLNSNGSHASLSDYHVASNETLDDLSEKLDSILETRYDQGADVSLADGVLTVVVDDSNTFVINKQTPNRQLWLSSPLSGPKRFDLESGRWIDKHSRVELRELLSEELSQLLKDPNVRIG